MMARPLANSEALSAIARRIAALPSALSLGRPCGARYCWPSSRQIGREASSISCRTRARRPGVNEPVAFIEAVHWVSSASAWPGSFSGRSSMSFFASASVCIGWSGSALRENARSLNLTRSKATAASPWRILPKIAGDALAGRYDGLALRLAHHFLQRVHEVDARIDLLAVDRDALHVDAERDLARVVVIEDAAQVVAAHLNRFPQGRRVSQYRSGGLVGDAHAEPAQEIHRFLAPRRREGEHDAPRLHARAAAVAQVVAQQPHAR